MKTKSKDSLVIIAFILTILGLLLTVYYTTIAEKINYTVFISSSILNLIIIIFFIRYLIKAKKAK
jgi:hypothetical protein